MRGGYFTEAMAWRDWLLRAVAGDVSKLQIMYGAGRGAPARRVGGDWLPGYENSAPVRIGNAASEQYQLDVYGEVMSALYSSAHAEGVHSRAAWDLQTQLIEFIEKGWTRARRRHLGGARAAAALHALQGHGLGGRRPRRAHARGVARPRGPPRRVARAAQRHLRRGVREGLQQEVGAFTQYYGSRPARRQRPHDPARRVPARHRPAGGLDGRGDPARAGRPRLRAALQDERRRRGRRPDRAGRAPSWPAPSGWWTAST